MRVKFLAKGNNRSLRWGSNPQLTNYELDVFFLAPNGQARP